ncbi:hypothetical protein D3C76_1816030 [compost metagenome]
MVAPFEITGQLFKRDASQAIYKQCLRRIKRFGQRGIHRLLHQAFWMVGRQTDGEKRGRAQGLMDVQQCYIR